MRISLSVPLLAALSLSAAPAAAQEFGQQGDISFGADRLMGIYILDDASFAGDGLSLGLGADPLFGWPYTSARLGIDGFIIDHLSLGGSLAFWVEEIDQPGPGDDDITGFFIYPRVGYAINFTDAFGLWLRGGISFWDIENTDDEVDLTFEAAFFATPVDNFGFTFGPTMDIGLTGDGDEGMAFGIVAAGLFGWL